MGFLKKIRVVNGTGRKILKMGRIFDDTKTDEQEVGLKVGRARDERYLVQNGQTASKSRWISCRC
jgi:hypothetical protein